MEFRIVGCEGGFCLALVETVGLTIDNLQLTVGKCVRWVKLTLLKGVAV